VAEQAPLSERVVEPNAAPDDVLRIEHVAKRFGPITALRDINLHLRKGEVLGLLGDNGAGKSTLVKIICGFHKQDSGRMWLKGEPYAPRSVLDARARGVDTVYQDLALVDELSASQNMFLRREQTLRPLPFLAGRKMRREARAALDEIGINIPRIDLPVARLSGGQRQAIAVARSLRSPSEIMLLDEPVAAMGVKERAAMLEVIERVREQVSASMILVAHDHPQVMRICDRVNVIEDGRIVLDTPVAQTSVAELADLMTRAVLSR
jgi:ABC-type sugar transport system ATPase subunit